MLRPVDQHPQANRPGVGLIKQAGELRQLKSRGRSLVGAVFRLYVVAYNLIRLTNLLSPSDVLA